MLKYVNKTVFKYLTLLVIIMLMGIAFLISSHTYISSLGKNLDSYAKLVQDDVKKIEYISYTLEKIKSDIFSLSAITKDSKKRDAIQSRVQKDILNIDRTINSLKFNLDRNTLKEYSLDYDFSQEYIKILYSAKPMLEELSSENIQIIHLLDIRDRFLKEKNKKISNIAYEIREFNSEIPLKVEFISRIVLKSKSLLKTNYKFLNQIIEEKKTFYWQTQVVLYIIALVILLFLVRNISLHIVELYHTVENRLYTDDLTFVGSRYSFMQDLENMQNPSLLLVDIDKFRAINELFGAKTGNEVLEKLAILMKNFCKERKYNVYRLSSDEFAFLKETAKEKDDLKKVAKDFNNFYKSQHIYIETIADTIELDFTFGAALGKGSTLSRADMALEYAKNNNLPYKEYSKEIDSTRSLKHNIFWKKEIQEGILEDNFIPFFQPIYNRKNEIVKYETLARLRRKKDDEVTYVTPYKFLDIAIKTKYYSQISKMVIFKSLEACKEKAEPISINIGKKDIINHAFVQELKDEILRLDIADNITLELIESEDISQLPDLKNFIKEFRNIGVKFAIDDFGSGFSNFSFILETSPDFIKIDGSLIRDIDTNKNSYELVKSIVAFSHALNKKVIAEFIHSKEVYDIAYDLNVDMFQGYYFSEPKENIK